MEIDTAADASIASAVKEIASVIASVRVKENLTENQILPPTTKLRNYNEKEIPIVGELFVKVKYNNQFHKLPLVNVKDGRLALFRKNWLSVIKLN